MQRIFIIPSLGCPAECKYCFGPHEGSTTMQRSTLLDMAAWLKETASGNRIEITFHGGEPLTAGIDFFRTALPLLREGISPANAGFSVQSNLWLLNDELCSLFREYKVSLGTSLDGPEHINDAQRGSGYFSKTMEGICLARKWGINVGCICTFTKQSAPYYKEIIEFFINERLNFSVHGAMPGVHEGSPNEWCLAPQEYGDLLENLMKIYIPNMDKVKIGTLDAMIKSVSGRHGGVCTFGNCLGDYLAVGPEGEIYPCQRLAGITGYIVGNVRNRPSMGEMSATPAWSVFASRENNIRKDCGSCSHYDICKGGCPYHVLSVNGGNFGGSLTDPNCQAYKRIFDFIMDKAMDEVFSSENLDAIVNSPEKEAGMLRKGRLISIMRGESHPYDTAKHARDIVMAASLAAAGSSQEAFKKLRLLGNGVFLDRDAIEIDRMHIRLNSPEACLNNLYLHVTLTCNLSCTHCYAEAHGQRNETMQAMQVEKACREAAETGFRKVVVTGGEPLVHPQAEEVLKTLAGLRKAVKPLLTVLRTNLSQEYDPVLFRHIINSTDQVVVSLDGNRETHDSIRGGGSYDRTVENLRKLRELDPDTEISLAAALTPGQIDGPPGEAVRSLAFELGLRRVRFKPVLPLGRAKKSMPDLRPGLPGERMDRKEMMGYGFTPAAACGIGQNLYVQPDGTAYPCYALTGPKWNMGNIFGYNGLAGVVKPDKFTVLGRHTINTNLKCGNCSLRFLCGSVCKVWTVAGEESDLDAPPVYCEDLRKRSQFLLSSALAYLGIGMEHWMDAWYPERDDNGYMHL